MSTNFEDLILRDTRANQPAAGKPGRLYYVTDEEVTERDNGSTWEDVSDAGGGGGAPTTSKYVVTEADGSLSAEKVLPFLANYSPDKAPGSPSSDNDEFDDDSIAGAWSQIGTPDTIAENTYHGLLYVKDNDSTACGVRKAYAPGAVALTVVVKLSFTLPVGFSNIMLAVETSAPANIAGIGIQNANSGGVMRARSMDGASESTTTITGSAYITGSLYLMITRDSGSNFLTKISGDGITWTQIGSFSNAGTIANVSVLMDSQGGGSTDASMVIDFIRFFTSQTEEIGAAP